MSARCGIATLRMGAPGTKPGGGCGAIATAEVEVGCIHEHITREPVCDEHAAKMTSGTLDCLICWAAGHMCKVIGRQEALVTPC